MTKLTCEHCGKRIYRGGHFVCQGKLVEGTKD